MRPKVHIDQIQHEEGSVWHLASSCGEIGNGFSIDLRIFDHGTSKARLRAAFSSQIASVTLPDDLAAFETLVRSAKKALESAGEARHTRALEGLWAAERSRLKARWAEVEASGVSADQVVLTEANGLASPSLVFRTTSISRRISRYDKDDFWGVCWDADGQPKVLGSHSRMTIQPLTQENLAPVPMLGDEEKRDLLTGSGGLVLGRLRQLFDERRLSRSDLPRATDLDGVVVVGSDIYYEDGRFGLFYARIGHKGPELFARLESAKAGIWAKTSKAGAIQLGRNVSSGNRFKTKDALDDWVRPLIEMILAFDPDLSDEVLKGLRQGPFDAAHPILHGLVVPVRHQRLVGAFLGKTYAAAARAADRAAVRTTARQRDTDAAKTLAKEIPDGAVFGTLKISKENDLTYLGSSKFNGTRLGIVRTRPTTSNRRTREIAPLEGLQAPRPLTPKQMSRLPLLTKPDALERLSDAGLGGDKRDIVEAAFRLSFHLPGEARNPILEGGASVTLTKSGYEGIDLRMSTIDGDTLKFLALSVCFPVRDALDQHHLTGAGFCAVIHGHQTFYWTRPALDENGYGAPEKHRDIILDALRLSEGSGLVVPLFHSEWHRMAKTYG